MSSNSVGPIGLIRPIGPIRLTTSHLTLARLHFVTAAVFFAFAGLLAMLMRWQLAWPGTRVPVAGAVLPSLRQAGGIIPPEVYAQYFSLHGTTMVFYVIIPILTGGFGCLLIPAMLGARELALPRVAFASYFVHLLGGVVLFLSQFVTAGAASSGWTAYAPLSVSAGAGQDLWIVSLILTGAAAIALAVSQIATIVHARAPGLNWTNLPVTIWGFLATGALTLLSTPALVAALVLLLLDRHAGTAFFIPPGVTANDQPLIVGAESTLSPAAASAAGQPLLWQHLFWFYAHPAVYIMILPAMGMMCEVISTHSRRPLFGYYGFIVSICSIAGLGFVVWGHHMFVSGMSPYLGAAFAAASLVIAIPSAVETFNWLATLWRAPIRFTTPMLHAMAFVSTFVVGGLSGVIQASTPLDTHLHNTYFVVAHIHYVLFGGTVFAVFAATTHWFVKLTGRMLNENLGRLHFALTFLAFNLTFFPMHLLGLRGMGRRLYDPTVYAAYRPLQPLNVWITWGAYALAAAQLVFVFNLAITLVRRRSPVASVNPWGAVSLEWQGS